MSVKAAGYPDMLLGRAVGTGKPERKRKHCPKSGNLSRNLADLSDRRTAPGRPTCFHQLDLLVFRVGEKKRKRPEAKARGCVNADTKLSGLFIEFLSYCIISVEINTRSPCSVSLNKRTA